MVTYETDEFISYSSIPRTLLSSSSSSSLLLTSIHNSKDIFLSSPPPPSTEMFIRRSSSMMSLLKGKGKEAVVEKNIKDESTNSFVTKLHRRNKNLRKGSLDFGCAGELTELQEEFYHIQDESKSSTHSYHQANSSISSIATSAGLPSLTHSRNQSSCSDLSSYTQDTTPPTSPTTSDHYGGSSPSSSKRSSHGSPGFHQKRQSDEHLAIDALNEYLTKVRLSVLIEEDTSARPNSTRTCTSSPLSVNNLLLPAAIITSRPLSYNNRPLSSSSSLLNNRPFSTSSLSNHTIIGRSPSPIAESSCHEDELDELYQFFSHSRSQSRCDSRASDIIYPSIPNITTATSSSSSSSTATTIGGLPPPLPPKCSSAPASIYSRYTSRSSKGIPRSSFQHPQLMSREINKLKDDRTVPYGWI